MLLGKDSKEENSFKDLKMKGNTIVTNNGKFRVLDKILTWRWVQKPQTYIKELVQEDKYLCVNIKTQEVVRIDPRTIEKIL